MAFPPPPNPELLCPGPKHTPGPGICQDRGPQKAKLDGGAGVYLGFAVIPFMFFQGSCHLPPNTVEAPGSLNFQPFFSMPLLPKGATSSSNKAP